MDAQMDNGSRSEEDRKAAESQEEIYDDIWRYLRGNNKIRWSGLGDPLVIPFSRRFV